MSRPQYWLLIIVAFIGGLTGGIISNRLIPENVFAFARDEVKQINQKQICAKTIIAEEYFLHAKKGANPLDGEIPIPRALLTTEPDGNPKFIMQDSNGNPRFSIQLEDKNGATLAIINNDGAKTLLISEQSSFGNTQTGSSVAMLDGNGQVKAQLGIKADNNPFLSLSDHSIDDKNACRSIKLGFTEKNKASIEICDANGNQRAKLHIDSFDTDFTLNDHEGNSRVELGNTKLAFEQDGSLKKLSSAGFSVEQRPTSSIVLYNKKGKVVWSAP